MTTTVENLKNEISDCYIKDLTKQLWWLKSIAVLPIQKPIKDILIWKGELPEKFDEVKEFWWRKKIIKFVSPQLATEIFEFMKSKRLEIEKRKTEAELTDLKNEILWLTPETTPPVQNPQSSTQSWNWSSIPNNSDWNNNIEEWDETSTWSSNPASWENQDSWLQESHGINWIVAWVETAVIWWASTLALEKIAAKNAKAIEQLSAPKLKSTIESVINVTEKKRNALEHRLTSKQLKNADKYIEKLKAGVDNIDTETVNLLKDWNKLWDKFKISRAILEQCWLTEKQLSQISDIADDLVKKPKKSKLEIKEILESKGIKSIDDSIIEALCKAEKPEEIKMMTQILKHWNRIPRMLQTLAGALWVDVVFSWLDVWMYIEQKKEAELISKTNELRWKNKSKQAWRQLWIWISSIAIEWFAIWLMGSAASGWPIWVAVGLGVWALTMAASFWVDNLYFDVADFYLQNQEDFLRQKRSQLKQAILQWIYNKKQWNRSFNEHVTSFLSPSLKPGSEKKEMSLNDACVSMIFLEEIDEGGKFAYNQLLREYIEPGKSKKDFLSEKDQNYKGEFEQVWEKLENRINVRMQYILKEFKKSDIINSIDKWTWMKDVTKIFTNSRAFAQLKELDKWDDSKPFEENLENYKAELLSEFPAEKVQQFEELRQNNPSLFMEIITTVSLDAFIYWEEDEEQNGDSNYVQNVKMVVAYKKRLELTESVEDKRYLNIDNIANSKFIENLLISDFDLSKVEYPTIESERLINMIKYNCERNWLTDILDDPLQNVLYRLARELFWYSWENEMQSLMWFFSESNDNNHWLYYTKERKVNKDWAIDKKLKDLIPSDFHDEDIDTIISNFISKNKIWQSSIDTPTESIDDELNLEFKNKIESLLRDELSCRSIEHKTLIKNQISDFVKQHSNWEYVELPYFLILEAKKSGLWDLQRQFFKRENGKMKICYLPSEINQTSLFDDVEKSYISPARESFTEEEQYYIDRVEAARKKIENIRSVWCIIWFKDDLNIPIEIEHLLSEKVNEREKFKQDILLYNESVASSVDEKYEEFASYFENMYKWMLISLMWFKVTNDINSFALFSQSLYYWNQNLFDESWKLLTIEWNKLLNDAEFKTFYDEKIKTLKIWSKTIKELWESDNSREKELAKQASNAIYITVLETCLINTDSSWNIISISIWNGTYYEPSISNNYNGMNWYNGYGSWYAWNTWVMQKRTFQKEQIIGKLRNRFEKMEIAPEISEYKVKQLLKQQEINKLTQQQKQTTDITPEIQKQIESTMDNVDWRFKREQIKFDTDTSTLKSWGNETKIILPADWSIETIHLDWLDLDLPIKEWLWLANFNNRIKSEYPNKKVEFWTDIINRRWIMGLLYGSYARGAIIADSWRKTLKINWTMLLNRSDLVKYCSVCKSDEAMKKITEWINNN